MDNVINILAQKTRGSTRALHSTTLNISKTPCTQLIVCPALLRPAFSVNPPATFVSIATETPQHYLSSHGIPVDSAGFPSSPSARAGFYGERSGPSHRIRTVTDIVDEWQPSRANWKDKGATSWWRQRPRHSCTNCVTASKLLNITL